MIVLEAHCACAARRANSLRRQMIHISKKRARVSRPMACEEQVKYSQSATFIASAMCCALHFRRARTS